MQAVSSVRANRRLKMLMMTTQAWTTLVSTDLSSKLISPRTPKHSKPLLRAKSSTSKRSKNKQSPFPSQCSATTPMLPFTKKVVRPATAISKTSCHSKRGCSRRLTLLTCTLLYNSIMSHSNSPLHSQQQTRVKIRPSCKLLLEEKRK
jgi:hypothetical protein